MKARDVMTKEVLTVTPGLDLKAAALVLVQNKVSGVVVVDEHGAVEGVLSEADILARERGAEPRSGSFLRRLFDAGGLDPRLDARLVHEAMTSPAITIGPNTALAEAAGIMLDAGVNRLPVVDDSKLVGIVTRADLVRAFTRSDEEILHEIRDDVIFRTLWIAPESVNVTVEHGEVTLSGEVETRTDAELLPAFVERVPGVVSVRSTLSYRQRETAGAR